MGGGQVIKAGTYKWVDTFDAQGIVDIYGDEIGIDGKFESSGIAFDFMSFSTTNTYGIQYTPANNFDSLGGEHRAHIVGYTSEKWVVCYYDTITDVPALQTFTILEDIDLTNLDLGEALPWFTANTTKLS